MVHNYFCLEGIVTKSQVTHGEVQITWGNTYRGNIHKLKIEINKKNYEVILRGTSPIQVNDQVRLSFDKSVPIDSDNPCMGYAKRTVEDILSSTDLEPNIVEKIVNGKVLFKYEQWPHG